VRAYNERKAEIEDRTIAVIKERLSHMFVIQDLHEKGFPFDLILVGRNTEEPWEQRIVKLWLYIVDMRGDKPRILGFGRPFTTGALGLVIVTRIAKNSRDYNRTPKRSHR